MALVGTAIGIGLGGFGEKPKVPPLQRLDTANVQAQTTTGNLQNLPGIQQLGAASNMFNQQQLLQMQQAANPFFQSLVGQGGNLISDMLRGVVPQSDVMMQFNRNAARAVGGGFGGTQMQNNLNWRDLGLLGYQQQQQGLNAAQNWLQGISALGVPQQFNTASQFFSPQEKLGFDFQQNLAQFQRRLLNNQVKAAADPAMAALTNAFIQDESAIMGMAGSALGMAGGGGGGGM